MPDQLKPIDIFAARRGLDTLAEQYTTSVADKIAADSATNRLASAIRPALPYLAGAAGVVTIITVGNASPVAAEGQSSQTPQTTESSKPALPQAEKHIVKDGEYLSRIAQQHKADLKRIEALNAQNSINAHPVKNPNLIKPKQQIIIERHGQHVVEDGDNLTEIANKAGTDVASILAKPENAPFKADPSMIFTGNVVVTGVKDGQSNNKSGATSARSTVQVGPKRKSPTVNSHAKPQATKPSVKPAANTPVEAPDTSARPAATTPAEAPDNGTNNSNKAELPMAVAPATQTPNTDTTAATPTRPPETSAPTDKSEAPDNPSVPNNQTNATPPAAESDKKPAQPSQPETKPDQTDLLNQPDKANQPALPTNEAQTKAPDAVPALPPPEIVIDVPPALATPPALTAGTESKAGTLPPEIPNNDLNPAGATPNAAPTTAPPEAPTIAPPEAPVSTNKKPSENVNLANIPSLGGVPADRIKNTMVFMMDKLGLTPKGAAYLAADFITESGLSLDTVGDNGAAKGLGQFRAERQNGMPTDSIENQLEWIVNVEMPRSGSVELQRFIRDPNATEAQLRKALQQWERYGKEGPRYEDGHTLAVAVGAIGDHPAALPAPNAVATPNTQTQAPANIVPDPIIGSEIAAPQIHLPVPEIKFSITGIVSAETSAENSGGTAATPSDSSAEQVTGNTAPLAVPTIDFSFPGLLPNLPGSLASQANSEIQLPQGYQQAQTTEATISPPQTENSPKASDVRAELKRKHNGVSGELTAAELSTIGDKWGGHKLNPGAVVDFLTLNDAFDKKFGATLKLTDSYRPLEVQKQLKQQKPRLAAKPGTSDHGWGIAVDVNATPEQKNWLEQNADLYNWTHPSWARKGGSKPEDWHYEWVGGKRNYNKNTPPNSSNNSLANQNTAQAPAVSPNPPTSVPNPSTPDLPVVAEGVTTPPPPPLLSELDLSSLFPVINTILPPPAAQPNIPPPPAQQQPASYQPLRDNQSSDGADKGK